MGNYSDYGEVKAGAYTRNASLYKKIVRILPRQILRKLFPVIGFIRAEPRSQVLDIGSGTGLYSHILRSRFGCECREVEPYMSNLYGAGSMVLRVGIGELPEDLQYDAILLIDVLEHLTDTEIQSLLGKIHRILKSTGSVYIKIPNASALAGLEASIGDLTHIQQFNSISLSTLAAKHGFVPRRVAGIGPNLSPARLVMRVLAAPFDLLLWLHLRARGCSGVLMAPAIMIEFSRKA